MKIEHTIIVGAGPCGMSCAIELQQLGMNPLIIEKGNIVHTIYRFPTHQVFFSSSDKLEIGNIPFITEKKKPVRNEALAYYREVANRKKLRINSFEKVISIQKNKNLFNVITIKEDKRTITYQAKNIIIATGYYDQPNYMSIPGENLSKVMHYFKEAHPYYNKNIVIIGGKNSTVDAALELYKAGAHITVLYRGDRYSDSIKPWILPEFDSLIRNNFIQMEFNAHVQKISPEKVYYSVNNQAKEIKNDFVFAMTGYQPNVEFLKDCGIHVHEMTGKPDYDEQTLETNIKRLYVAGVVAAGFNNNDIFIENGRYHGKNIAEAITNH